MPVVALVLAAGAGRRLGGAVPKGFATLAGEPILVRAVRAAAEGGVDRIVVVAPRGRVDDAVQALRVAATEGWPGGMPLVVPGGATRVDSARLGLLASPGADDDIVVVHDAARPLASPELFRRVVEAVRSGADGATVALASSDTIAVVAEALGDGPEARITSVPDRTRLVRVQTPQAFRRSVLEAAHARAAASGETSATDDAGLVLRHVPDANVVAVAGDDRNIKITRPEDLAVAERGLPEG